MTVCSSVQKQVNDRRLSGPRFARHNLFRLRTKKQIHIHGIFLALCRNFDGEKRISVPIVLVPGLVGLPASNLPRDARRPGSRCILLYLFCDQLQPVPFLPSVARHSNLTCETCPIKARNGDFSAGPEKMTHLPIMLE